MLRVGPRRGDGLHEIASLFASLELADTLSIEESDRDQVICPGVAGPNLAARALAAFRAAGGSAPPLRIEIDKRIPVAGGLGGGSADAAAVLRVMQRRAPLPEATLRQVAQRLGSDVPSQLRPGHAIVTGTGERVEPVELPPMILALVPAAQGLSTAAVYDELDRMRPKAAPPTRPRVEGFELENDLQAAALSLRPELSVALERLREAGARDVLISGSGPTCFGIFGERSAAERVEGAVVTAVRQ